MIDSNRVCGGIITYNPKIDILAKLFHHLLNELEALLVIDNFSKNRKEIGDLISNVPSVHMIQNLENKGIAAAVNQLADYARQRGCQFILPFDQDSLPERGMSEKLVRAFEQSENQSNKIAAVGPSRIDPRTGRQEPFIRFRLPLNKRFLNKNTQGTIETDFLITSGCLISIKALQHIGLMEEGLFIDNVDLEWSFRARQKGYRLLGVMDACMVHRIGDVVKRVPFTALSVRYHSPVRTYYMTKNRLILYRRSYVPFAWKFHDFFRFIFKIAAIVTTGTQQRAHFKFFRQGVRCGIKGSSIEKH